MLFAIDAFAGPPPPETHNLGLTNRHCHTRDRASATVSPAVRGLANLTIVEKPPLIGLKILLVNLAVPTLQKIPYIFPTLVAPELNTPLASSVRYPLCDKNISLGKRAPVPGLPSSGRVYGSAKSQTDCQRLVTLARPGPVFSHSRGLRCLANRNRYCFDSELMLHRGDRSNNHRDPTQTPLAYLTWGRPEPHAFANLLGLHLIPNDSDRPAVGYLTEAASNHLLRQQKKPDRSPPGVSRLTHHCLKPPRT